MKLILTIVQDSDREPVSQALIQEGFRVTQISSTGGFFRKGMSTLISGVEDDQVDEVINLLRRILPQKQPTEMKNATLFVLPIEQFTQI